MIKVNNKDTKTMPIAFFWCLYCQLWPYFTLCSSASIVNFEHVIAGCVLPDLRISLQFPFISQELSSHHFCGYEIFSMMVCSIKNYLKTISFRIIKYGININLFVWTQIKMEPGNWWIKFLKKSTSEIEVIAQ